MKVCSIVLAGGKSTRMGTNKSLLTIGDQPVIELIVDELQACSEEVILITNDNPEAYDFLKLRQFSDRFADKGPLAGIETALYYVQAETFILAACDMPFIDRQVYNHLLEKIKNYDAVIPIYNGRMHPLSGVYTKNVLPKVQEQLNENNLSIRSFFKHIHVKYVEEFNGISNEALKRHFFNMNNPEQYEQAKSF